MIAATINDPRLFAESGFSSGPGRALLLDHLSHVAHSHMIMVDTQGVLGNSLRSAVASLPAGIRKRAESALSSKRLIRLTPDAQRMSLYESTGIDRGTAMALALSRAAVDAVICDEEGKTCAVLIDGDSPVGVFTLPEFLASSTHDRLLCTMGAVSTGGMPRADFADRIVGPVLRWAKSPRIIDRYITTAMYEKDPDDSDPDNQWNRVRDTVRFLYDLWETTAAQKKDAFRIVTKPFSRNRWGGRAWHCGECPSLAQQAVALAEALDLGEHAIIEFIKVPANLSDVEHDRYLVTEKEIIISFSRGFDLIRPNGMLLESSVSLYHPGSQSSVLSMLLRAKVLATCSMTDNGWET